MRLESEFKSKIEFYTFFESESNLLVKADYEYKVYTDGKNHEDESNISNLEFGGAGSVYCFNKQFIGKDLIEEYMKEFIAANGMYDSKRIVITVYDETVLELKYEATRQNIETILDSNLDFEIIDLHKEEKAC